MTVNLGDQLLQLHHEEADESWSYAQRLDTDFQGWVPAYMFQDSSAPRVQPTEELPLHMPAPDIDETVGNATVSCSTNGVNLVSPGVETLTFKARCDFDASAYGSSYMTVNIGEHLQQIEHHEADEVWSFAQKMEGAEFLQGWVPAYIFQAMTLEAPCVEAVRHEAPHDFNGREYGPEYLIVHQGECLEKIDHPEADDWWSYARCINKSLQGWVPTSFFAGGGTPP